MVDFTSDTLSGDIRRCILKKKMGNIGGFRVPKKALFSGFQPFFGHFKGPEWCQTKIPGHATPAEQSPTIAERICGFWFQGSFVQIMAHYALLTPSLVQIRITSLLFNVQNGGKIAVLNIQTTATFSNFAKFITDVRLG